MSDRTSLLGEIEELLRAGDLEPALERLRGATDGGATRLASDVALLQSRASRLMRDRRNDVVRREDYNIELNQLTTALLSLAGEIASAHAEPATSAEDAVAVAMRSLGTAEMLARGNYLNDARENFKNLRRESIHSKCFIDLDVADTPVATKLPWVYKNSETAQEFESIAAAFLAYRQRLLILGAPGAGKSVTLWELAGDLIAQAERSVDAPIPLVVNLSKFRFAAARPAPLERLLAAGGEWIGSPRAFEDFLVEEFARKGVSRADARRWIEEDRVAALLDGLDEVNDERRAELVVLLNATYLRDHPNQIVVVCSRIEEYRPLQDRKETRLLLRGAITLQPLGPGQIEAYLEAANASGLREALGRDKTLDELAQTPLTLSMMVLAYGGLAAEKIPSFPLAADYRHHLMETYVARMLQRKERRDRGDEFDRDSDKEVKPEEYRYSPERMNRYLSWWAVCLSVRMQTAVPVRELHRFLARDQGQQPLSAETLIVRLVDALFLALCMLVAVVAFVPSFGAALTVAATAAVAFCLLRYAIDAAGPSPPSYFTGIGATLLGVFALLWVAALSRSIAALGPRWLGAQPAGLIVLAAASALFVLAISKRPPGPGPLLFAAMTASGIALGLMVSDASWIGLRRDILITGATVAGFLFGSMIAFWTQKDGLFSLKLVGTVVCLIAVVGTQALALWVVDSLHWILTSVLVSSVLVPLVFRTDASTAPAVGISIACAIGGLLDGQEGALIGLIALGIVALAVGTATKPSSGREMLNALDMQIEQRLLTPPAIVAAAAIRCAPLRLRGFLDYGGQALILKPYHGEVEFVHRRLRDYFALRKLIPQLDRSGSRDQRAGVINAIGFQGAAAIDVLAELITQGAVEERAIAVGAIARIAAPEVMAHLESAMADPAPEVRRAVVGNLRNLAADKRRQILTDAASDPEVSVKAAVIDAGHEESSLVRRLVTMLLDDAQNRAVILRHIALRPTSQWMTHTGDNLSPDCKGALETLLTDADGRVRAAACTWMGENPTLANPASISALLRSDSEAAVRHAAALALSRLDDERAAEPLIGALIDESSGVRIVAAQALGQLGDLRAIDGLSALLVDRESLRSDVMADGAASWLARPFMFFLDGFRDNSRPRRTAALALGRLADARSGAPLTRALRDPASEVRRTAADMLALLDGAPIAEALIGALADRQARVRRAAAHGLGRCGDPRAVPALSRTLADRDAEVRLAAARSLGRITRAAPQPTPPRADENPPDMPRDAIDVLLSAATGKGILVQAEAKRALREWRGPRATDALIARLTDADATVRALAAETLGALGDARAIAPLCRALATDTPSVRVQAASALGELGDSEAVAPLIAVLATDDQETRNVAIRALGALGDPRAIDPLIRELSGDSHKGVAAQALATFRDARATSALLDAFADPRVWDAATALRGSGETRALDPPLERLKVALSGTAEVPDHQRMQAATVLGYLGDLRATDTLVAVLSNDGRDDVRKAAADALGTLRDPRAVPALIEALADDEPKVRAAAARALGSLCDARATQALRDCFSREQRRAFVGGYAQLRDDTDGDLLVRTDAEAADRSSYDWIDARRPAREGSDWLDPHAPITQLRVAVMARNLSLSEDDVRRRYEAMAQDLALRLAWEGGATA